MTGPLVLAAALAGVGLAALAGYQLLRRREDRRWGELLAIDAGRPVTLRSERYRLCGRPDVLRRGSDGSVVPVEVKHRPLPARGPFRSHSVQIAAYCLLVEETTGRAPPFGILRYDDGEAVVPWTAERRAEIVALLRELAGPYAGRADPSPAKCAGCRWSPECSASLAPAAQPRGRVLRAM